MTLTPCIKQILCCFLISGQVLATSISVGSPLSAPNIPPHTLMYLAEEGIQLSIRDTDDVLAMISQVNSTRLTTFIQHIQEFGPHPTGSDAIEAMGMYLYNTLGSFQLSVRYDPWRYKLRSGNNIEATLPGTESCDTIIVLSAHYDTISISPGANDDGSGVAVVLAAAEILSQYRFNSTIRFVLFSGEEQGLLGSHEYVQNAVNKGEHILGNLNLDGVGNAMTAEDGMKIKHLSNEHSAWMVDYSSTIAATYHDVIGLEVIRLPHVTFGDHDSFVQQKYDGTDFWQYGLSPYYHTTEDTLEHMNITYLAKVCKLTIGTLASMAKLHPHLSRNDIHISIRGHALSYPSQFSVQIEKTDTHNESANVTINIQMRNRWTNQFVLMNIHSYTLPCNWTSTDEIDSSWEFKSLGGGLSSQFVTVKVIVKGIKDDYPLYCTQQTNGIIAARSVFLLPK
jgi:aminopeptidase YwaD